MSVCVAAYSDLRGHAEKHCSSCVVTVDSFWEELQALRVRTGACPGCGANPPLADCHKATKAVATDLDVARKEWDMLTDALADAHASLNELLNPHMQSSGGYARAEDAIKKVRAALRMASGTP